MLQCVAVCCTPHRAFCVNCSELKRVAVCSRVLQCDTHLLSHPMYDAVFCVCCSMVQSAAHLIGYLACAAVCCSAIQRDAVRCSVLQIVAVCVSVLQ